MLFHVTSISNDTTLRTGIFQDTDSSARTRLPMTPGTAPGVSLQVHIQDLRLRQAATDESGAMTFAPCLAIQVPAATIAEPSRARSSVGRAPPSHGGGQGFEPPRVHFLFVAICRLNAMIKRRRRHALELWCSNAACTETRTRLRHRPPSRASIFAFTLGQGFECPQLHRQKPSYKPAQCITIHRRNM
jgi:hypothetical protein